MRDEYTVHKDQVRNTKNSYEKNKELVIRRCVMENHTHALV